MFLVLCSLGRHTRACQRSALTMCLHISLSHGTSSQTTVVHFQPQAELQAHAQHQGFELMSIHLQVTLSLCAVFSDLSVVYISAE